MTLVVRPRRAPFLRGGGKWVALGFAALSLVTGLALGSSRPPVSELRRVGGPKIARIGRSVQERPLTVQTIRVVEESVAPAARNARQVSSAPAAVASKPRRSDPVLGF